MHSREAVTLTDSSQREKETNQKGSFQNSGLKHGKKISNLGSINLESSVIQSPTKMLFLFCVILTLTVEANPRNPGTTF